MRHDGDDDGGDGGGHDHEHDDDLKRAAVVFGRSFSVSVV